MNTAGNTILITGGATGIGFALAEALLKAENEVVICGRREHRLKEAMDKLPGVKIKACDIAVEKERRALLDWATENFKDLNMLINNAGIQKAVNLRKGEQDLLKGGDEIATNLTALVHLCALFIPHLMSKNEAAIVNISSGLGFVPMAGFPVYCATKAAVHSFTLSLRHQLQKTSVRAFELIPPMVDTELGFGTTGKETLSHRGIQPDVVAAAFLAGLAADNYEMAVGQAASLVARSRQDPDGTFRGINSR
jgi:uncharacterized oxidoreductase